MKILNSISQLQDQMSFCPLCQKKNRKISIENNSLETQIVHCRGVDNQIRMRVHTDASKSFKKVITYSINIDNDDFDFVYHDKPNDKPPSLDFLIVGKCPENHANAAGMFSLNTTNKKVESIHYNRETLSIPDTKCCYRISVLYYNDTLLASTLGDREKVRSFPLMELDFSRPDKIVTKIKTLLLFS